MMTNKDISGIVSMVQFQDNIGIDFLNEYGINIVSRTQKHASRLMGKARNHAIEWLLFVDYIESMNPIISGYINVVQCAAVKLAALQTIALQHSLPIELKGIAV